MKLKLLGMKKTTGELRGQASSSSSSAYVAASSGKALSEVWYQESTGILQDERLGTDRNIWLPFSAITDAAVPLQGDLIDIDTSGDGSNDTTYEILEVKAELFSEFEDHYEIKLKEPNA